MSKRARRAGGALSLLGLLALVGAGLAMAGSTPPPPAGPAQPGKVRRVGQSNPGTAAPANPVHVTGYRLTAKLAPASSTSSASGKWDGILVHTLGVVKQGAMPSVPGCSVSGPRPGGPGQAPPRGSGIPHKIACGGAVPPFPVPGSGNHWILGWRLTFQNLSSTVNGTDIRIQVPGAASAVAATLCGPCTSGKVGHVTLTDDQAAGLVNGYGSVVVRTVNSPTGEISGPIVKAPPTAMP
jgi:hypothetical protein